MKEQNRIYNTDMYSYNACEAVHVPKNMTPEELTKAYWELYNEVYSYRSIFKRTIFVKNFWRRPFTSFFYLGVELILQEAHQTCNVKNIV